MKRIIRPIIQIIIICICIQVNWCAFSWADDSADIPGSSPEQINFQNSTAKKILYKTLPGDTYPSIAKRFLDGPNALLELLNYNHLTPSSPIRVGMVIVIPGEERNEAYKTIEKVKKAYRLAQSASADIYAPNELIEANSMLVAAEESCLNASYDKANALGALSLVKMKYAQDVADQRAVVPITGKINIIHGQVEVSTDAGTSWQLAINNQKYSELAIIKTGDNSRVELEMADGSIIQIHEKSEFRIDVYTQDKRNQKTNLQLHVTLGNILGKINEQKHKDTTIHIRSRETSMAVRGTQFRFSGDREGTTRIALLEGDVDLFTPQENISLDDNYGTIVPIKQPPIPPVELLPPPVLEKIPSDQLKTSNQSLELRWKPVNIEVKQKTHQGIKLTPRKAQYYHVEIANDERFNAIVQEELVSENYFKSKVLSPGNYYWRISSVDEAGLEGAVSATRSLIIIRKQDLVLIPENDPIVRDGRWIIGPNWTVGIKSIPENNSLTAYECSLNDGLFTVVEDRVFFRDEGIFSLKVRGVGKDGHKGEILMQTIEVDATPPLVDTFISPVSLDANGNRYVNVTINAFDKSGVKRIIYRINNGPQQTYNGTITLQLGKKAITKFKLNDVKTQNFNIIFEAFDLLDNRHREVIDLSY